MHRALSLTAATALAVVVTTTTATGAAAAPNAATYHGLATPVRALDTREASGAGPLDPGESRELSLATLVSPSATAVVLNVTVAGPTAAGYLTVYPADAASRPTASSINFRPGDVRSNNVTVALPAGTGVARAVDLFNFAGTTPTVVDVLGYYAPAVNRTDGSTYDPAPAALRVEDTRRDGGPVAKGGSRIVTVPAPELAGVTDLAVTITAVAPTGGPGRGQGFGLGYLTAWSGVGTEPATSTVNYGGDPATPNFAIVPVVRTATGALTFRIDNAVSTADVVVDVDGYYAVGDAQGLAYVAEAPTRVYDSREAPFAAAGPLGPNSTRDVAVSAVTPAAVNLTVTAVDATDTTFLTVFPQGVSRPLASNLNPYLSSAYAGAVQTAVTSSDAADPGAGVVSVYNLRGTVDLVVDRQGYFIPFD